MRGNIIGFDPLGNSGALSGQDGRRYDFATLDWHASRQPTRGDLVDFVPNGERATQIYMVEPEYVRPSWTDFLFSFRGRISRRQYWLHYVLPYLVVMSICAGFDGVLGWQNANGVGVLTSLLSLASIWPGLAVAVKRCHDRDRSGWFILVGLIPIVGGIWLLIELGFLRGTVGANRFGPDPVRHA